MNHKHKRLVILSNPFTRLTRGLLGAPVLGAVRQHCDVVIVSPFADNSAFQSEFGASGTRFLQWQAPERLGQPLRGLLTISELLRRQGYWRRFRKQGMAYYLAVNHIKFGDDGNDERIRLRKRLILFIITIVGMWSRAWRIPDRLVGRLVFNFEELRKVGIARTVMGTGWSLTRTKQRDNGWRGHEGRSGMPTLDAYY